MVGYTDLETSKISRPSAQLKFLVAAKMKKRGFDPLFYSKTTSTIVKSSSKYSKFPKFFA